MKQKEETKSCFIRNFEGSPIFRAAKDGEIESVTRLIEGGVNIHKTDSLRRTPLYVAGLNGHFDIVSLLIKHGADINATNFEGRALIHNAADDGNVDHIKKLYELGADINKTNQLSFYHKTPMDCALEKGHFECVTLLLKLGANNSKYVLAELAKQGQAENIRTLINELGIDIALFGKDAMSQAVQHGQIECIKVLDELGVDVLFGKAEMFKTAIYGRIESVRVLYELGLDIHNLVNQHDRSLIHCLAYSGGVESITTVHEFGADINNSFDFVGNTLIHSAVEFGKTENVKALIELGADINWIDKKGKTPLHTAAYFNEVEIALLIASAGAVESENFEFNNEEYWSKRALLSDIEEQTQSLFIKITTDELNERELFVQNLKEIENQINDLGKNYPILSQQLKERFYIKFIVAFAEIGDVKEAMSIYLNHYPRLTRMGKDEILKIASCFYDASNIIDIPCEISYHASLSVLRQEIEDPDHQLLMREILIKLTHSTYDKKTDILMTHTKFVSYLREILNKNQDVSKELKQQLRKFIVNPDRFNRNVIQALLVLIEETLEDCKLTSNVVTYECLLEENLWDINFIRQQADEYLASQTDKGFALK